MQPMPDVGGPITRWELLWDYLPMGAVCPMCFVSSPTIVEDGGAHPSSRSPKSDEGGATGPSKPCEWREATERPDRILLSTASNVGEITPFNSDAGQIPFGVANPVGSSFGVSRRRYYRKESTPAWLDSNVAFATRDSRLICRPLGFCVDTVANLHRVMLFTCIRGRSLHRF